MESTGLGKTLFQMLVREGLPVKDLDKVTRVRSAAVRMESRSIYFRKDAHWLPEYEDELMAFDIGIHDD